MSVHDDCKCYIKEYDMCIRYADLGFRDVSKYEECLDVEAYK